MNSGFPMTPLSECLLPVERPEVPVAGKLYRQIGVRLWGEGAYEREPIDGSQTKYATLSRVETDDIIVNKIWARNGSVAVVSEYLAGCYGSGEFPTFTPIHERLNPRWFRWFTKTKSFWNQCDEKSRGTSGKNRIRPEKFLEILIPLPPLEEQRRIVARIEELAAKIEEARGLRREAVENSEELIRSLKKSMLHCEGKTLIRDFATIQSGYAFKSDSFENSGIRLVRNINISHGYIDWQQVAYISKADLKSFSRFNLSEGDILISLDRPIISTGIKVARISKKDLPCLLVQRVGRVLFRNNDVLPEYFYEWLSSPYFEAAINPGRSNGIPHISPKDIELISFVHPSIYEQRRVVASLRNLQSKVDALKQLQSETSAELDALLPSILDKAFKREL